MVFDEVTALGQDIENFTTILVFQLRAGYQCRSDTFPCFCTDFNIHSFPAYDVSFFVLHLVDILGAEFGFPIFVFFLVLRTSFSIVLVFDFPMF